MTVSPAKQGSATHLRILDSATRLFAANGYAATGVAQIAGDVGIGKSALYYHIGSKDQLLFDICRAHVEDMLSVGESIARSGASAEVKLRALGREHIRAIAAHLSEIVIYFREGHHLRGQEAVRLTEIRAREEEVWASVMRQGVAEGVFDDASPISVKGVLGIFNYSWMWLKNDGSLTSDEIADRLTEIALGGLGFPAGHAPGPARGSTRHRKTRNTNR